MKTTKLQKTQNGTFLVYNVVSAPAVIDGKETITKTKINMTVGKNEKEAADLLSEKGIRAIEILAALEAMDEEMVDTADFGMMGTFISAYDSGEVLA